MATERLRVILEMVAGQYKKEAREASTATGKLAAEAESAGTKTGQLEGKMTKFGGALRGAAVLGGIAAVGRGLSTAIESAEQAASALANTEQIIEQTGGAANVTADDILEMSSRLSALTGVQDDIVQEGANVLLTFKNLKNEAGEGNDVFDRTAALMLDIGAVMGTDASSAALQLGKALNDPVSQMGALSRAGLTFDASQKEMIKTLVESGNLMEAQKLILSELESQLGGTAAASADASDKIRNAFDEIAESVGTVLLPFLDTLAIELQQVTGTIDELDRLSLITGQSRDSAELLLGALAQLSDEQGLDRNFAKGIEGYVRESQKLIDISGLTISELGRTRDGLDFLVEGGYLSAEAAEELADILDQKLNSELARLVDQGADKVLKGQLAPALEETGEAGEDAADGLDEATEASDGLSEATKRATERLERFQNLVKGQVDPIFALRDAQSRLAEAQLAVVEAQDEFGTNSPEYIDALSDLTEAGYDLEEAQIRVATESRLTREAFEEQLRSMRIFSEEQIAAMLEEFEELNAFKFDDKDFFITVYGKTVITEELGDKRTQGARRTASTGPIAERRHSGGPVTAGQPYIVGERGEELFVPDRSGQILSNETLRSISNSRTFDLTINYPQTSGDDIVDGVRRGLALDGLVGIAENTP